MLAIITHLPRSLIQFALPALMLLIGAVTLQTSPLQAQAVSGPAARVKDILSPPYSNSFYGRAEGLTVVGDKLFFDGHTSRSGTELWVSDGTEAGTRMAKDIFPGSRNAGPSVSAPAVFGEVLFFSADDGSHGRELWLSDGTEAGTRMVKDIVPGPNGSDLRSLTFFRDAVYFVANDGVAGPAIWRSDGSAAGTTMVVDVSPSTLWHTFPSELTPVGGTLFFVADDGSHGRELWATDGTEAGTRMVKDIVPGASESLPLTLTALGDKLLFSTSRTKELWLSDGTEAGTRAIAPVYMLERLVSGDQLFFRGSTQQYGTELWVSDGTQVGTHLVIDLAPGSQGSYPGYLTALDGVVYFINHYSPRGSLWRSDGTAGGTTMVFPGVSTGYLATDLAAGLGRLFFTTGTAETGWELWTSDGTGAGTQLFQELLPGPSSAAPGEFIEFGGRLLFVASNKGRNLWVTDGTPGDAAQVAMIDPSGHLGSQPASLVATGPRVLFGATSDGARGNLYTSNGSTEGTDVLTSTNVYNLVGLGGWAYLLTNEGRQHSLFRSDGTPAGTSPIDVTDTLTGTNPMLYTLDDRLLYTEFSSWRDNTVRVWMSDAAGTMLQPLATIPPTGPPSRPSGPYQFLAAEQVGGVIVVLLRRDSQVELWRCPGSGATAELLKTGDLGWELVSTAGGLLFSAEDTAGRELWVSNGTVTGTLRLADLSPGSESSNPAGFVSAGGRAFFSATDAEHGRELWMSDGTPAGTALVEDIMPGPVSSNPSPGTMVGETVYYSAWDVEHGRELWASDGTPTGTALVRDIMPGPSGSVPSELTAVRHSLVFAASDGVSGYELWRSDSTGLGATLVQDLVPGPQNGNPQALTVAGEQLFFTAQGADDGRELWAAPLDGVLSEVPPMLSDAAPGNGTYGTTYSHTFSASGEPPPSFQVASGSLPPGLSLDPATGVLSGTPTRAGTYSDITVSAQNDVGEPAMRTFTIVIAKAQLEVAADAGTKLYGRPLPELSYQVSGLLNGDTTASALTGALATTATASSPVGSYPISQGTLAATNYGISFTGAALTITPAPLAVRADDQTVVVGGPLPELTYVANGLVNGDSVTTTLTGSLATTATASSPVGSYLISQGTLAATNYTLSFTSGTLRVTQAPSAPTWHLYLPFIERGPGNDIFTTRLSNRSTATLNSQGEHSPL